MTDNSRIEWTDATWNPVTGCATVSPGCDHCYAETIAHRFAGSKAFPAGFAVTLHPERLEDPLRWRTPRRVFVNSMSDLFHDAVPDEFIVRIFAVMHRADQHVFQVLTKRHGRLRSLLSSTDFHERVVGEASTYTGGANPGVPWPLPNVWLGVSTETQQWADIRVPALLDTPAAARFVSAEPLLGPTDLSEYLHVDGLDWVIVGGESGPDARPMHPDWARQLRDQCRAAECRFFFKQWGSWAPIPVSDGIRPGDVCLSPDGFTDTAGPDYVCFANESEGALMRRATKPRNGRLLDGRTWDEFPDIPDGRPPTRTAAARVTAAQKRRHLRDSGWLTTLWLCPSDPARLPERWYRRGETIRHTIGAAFRLELRDMQGGESQ